MIEQLRYFGDNNFQNYPLDQDLKLQLATGAVFEDYLPLEQVGIQAPSGTKVYFNDNNNPIYIGATGIYEVNTPIFKINFDYSTLNKITADHPLIIDLIYSNKEVKQ